jgi:two-component system, NarL family, sensor histidine kinase DevS
MQPSTASPAATPLPNAPRVQPTRGPPASNGRAPAGRSAPGPAAAIRLPTKDHERIGQDLSDVVTGRLFSAGLDLQAALALIGDPRVAGKIEQALGELDLAIRDLRDTVFHRWAT